MKHAISTTTALVAVAVAAFVASVAPPGAIAQTDAQFEAVGAADGVRIAVSQPGFGFVEQYADSGAPVAQALVDRLGNSKAHAAYPYPGDVVLTGPSLAAALSGLPAPPAYPLIASSTFPTTQQDTVEAPGYALAAKSEASASQASASAGGGSEESVAVGRTSAKASASHDERTGRVSASASSAADSFALAGVLRIGSVRSTASVSRLPGRAPERKADVAVEGVTVAGQGVELRGEELVVAGTRTPLAAASGLATTLAERGIELRYLAPVEIADGIVAPGVEVTYVQPVPNATPLRTTYLFGRARASAAATGGAPAVTAGPAIGATSGAPADSDDQFNPPSVVPATQFGASRVDSALRPPLAGQAAERVDTSPLAPSFLPADTNAPLDPAASTSAMSFYLIAVVGGLLAFGGGTLIRLLGVKLAWTTS